MESGRVEKKTVVHRIAGEHAVGITVGTTEGLPDKNRISRQC
jgi:hypothetical protein